MNKLRILITNSVHPDSLAAIQRDPGLEITVREEPVGRHGLDLIDWPAEWLRDKDILFSTGVFPKNFAAANAMKWVQMASAGYEHAIDLKIGERGVRASNALGVFDVAIGEWCIGMIVALARDLRGMIRNQERAVWDRNRRFQQEIRGSAVGFWGYGGLARETARLCKAMGLKIHVLSRSGSAKARPHHYLVPGCGDPEGKLPDRVFSMDQKDDFLRGLDFLIVAMPQTPRSAGAIGERELRSLKPTAYVLNPARGPLIQEQALIKALREQWIAGAALDAHYHYPMPPEHPLWKFPNVIMTPHISGSGETTHYLPRTWDIFLQNLSRYREGAPLLNELTPAQLRGE